MSAEPFRVVMADCPWPFADKIQGPKRGAAKHYRLLAMHRILTFALPPIADDAALFLWRVASMQQEALDVVKGWGFELKTELVWRKLTKHGKRHFGMGRTVRAEHETCLVATRGKPKPLSRSVRSVFGGDTIFEAKIGQHSAKPEAIYEIVESLFPGPYLSVFDRRQRAGWTSLGDQVELAVPYAGPRVDALPLLPHTPNRRAMEHDKEQPGEGDNFDPETGEVTQKQPEEAEEDTVARSFPIFVTQVRDGEISAELSEMLGKLLDDLTERAEMGGVAVGELKLCFKFKVDNRGVVNIVHEADVKLPKLKPPIATMWMDKSGRLVPANPRQTKLALHAVDPKKTRKQVDVSRPRRIV